MSICSLNNYAHENAHETERWNWHDRVFSNYSVKQGLPHGPVSMITEDNTGFIWLISTEGLMRFDGHNFETVTSKYPQVNNTKVIARDSTGALWLGTNEGLVSLNPDTRRFKPYKLLSDQKLSVVAIAMDKAGKSPDAWVGTNKGVFKFNTLTFKAEHFLKKQMAADTGMRIFNVIKADNGTVWVGTNRGLLYKSQGEQKFYNFDLSATLTSSLRISALLQDTHGDIWVGTPRDGVILINSKLIVSQPVIPKFSQEWIYSIAEVSPGVVWLGSYGQGVIEMNAKGNNPVRIQHNRLMESSLGHDEIWQIYTANNGMIWLGTSKGLSLYNSRQTSIKSLFGDTGRNNGISDANVNSLLEDHQGRVWLGLREKGIDIIDPKIGRIDHVAVKPQSPEHALPGGAIETMKLQASGDIYIGSNWGVYRHSQSKLNRVKLNGRDVDKYTGTLEIIDDTLWAGGTDGLWQLGINSEDKRVVNSLSAFSTKFSDNRISAISKTPNEELIIGTWNGIHWINKAGELTSSSVKNNTSALPGINSYISSLFYDHDERLWVATEGAGIYVAQAKNHAGNFIQITKEQGLSSNIVRAMQLDDEGRVWVSSNAGIDVIDRKSLSVQSILPQEGALLAPYFRQAALKTSAGEIVFGGSGGITVIDPNLWQVSPAFFPLTVVSTHVGNNVYFEPLLGVNEDQPVVIEPEQNNITVEFVTLDYVAVSAISYRYRLLGLSEQWQLSNSQYRVAAFTTLPPGSYKLEIQNTNRLGDWNSDSHFMYIKVLPHWYQTFWTKLIGLFLVIVLALLIIRIRTESLKKRQLSLEEQVRQRTLSLQKVTEELDRMSVTDPLTGMNNRRFLERNMPAESALVIRRYQDFNGKYKRIDDADLVFFLIDIDHFKKINDEYGHKAGDAVLIEVTKRLRQVARESDFLVRWGGEEFLLVVRETSLPLARTLADRLCQQFKGEQFKINETTKISITCSVGFSPFPFYCNQPETVSWLECIDIADKALYTAKNSGRDAWVGVMVKESINDETHHAHVMDIAQGKLNLESNLEQSLVETNWWKL